MKRDALVTKAKDKMIKPLGLHVRSRGRIIGRGAGVSPIKPQIPIGIGVSPLKKTPTILVFGLSIIIKGSVP